eukprot:jgi/Mesvir1/19173/Mv01192-RA.2
MLPAPPGRIINIPPWSQARWVPPKDGHDRLCPYATHGRTMPRHIYLPPPPQVVSPGNRNDPQDVARGEVIAQVSLLPSVLRVTAGRRPVALAAGYLDPANPHEHAQQGGDMRQHHGKVARGPRKQVVVVVTAGWTILAFDHNLRPMWENTVQEEFPAGSHHKEVAVLVSSLSIRQGDRGLIVVGGSMESEPQKADSVHGDSDIVRGEESAEEAAATHSRSYGNKAKLEDAHAPNVGGADRHFSYFAYEGSSGNLRWKHDSHDFHRDASALSQELLPQHNYKLDAVAMNSRHYGEVECRQYRESVLASMPHRWERRDDTAFHLMHFRKHRRATSKGTDAGGPPTGGIGHSVGEDDSNAVARAVSGVVAAVTGTKRTTSTTGRGGAGGAAALAKHHHAGSAHHGKSAHLAPNVIVSHMKEGIEAVHLHTGRTLCKLLLPATGTHGDINGDGVLDHVTAIGSHSGGNTLPHGLGHLEAHGPVRRCWAVATSGVPVQEQLFNGSICRSSVALDMMRLSTRTFGRDATHEVEVAVPILMPYPRPGRTWKAINYMLPGVRHRGLLYDAIFLNSFGEVTSYSSDGHILFQVGVGAAWTNAHVPAGMAHHRVVPTLEPLALRVGGHPEVILAIGQSRAALLSTGGQKVGSFEIPSSPNGKTVIADFNGDGLNDIVVTTTTGLYGYAQTRRPGAMLFSGLLAVLLIIMGIVLVTQQLHNPKGQARAMRSTD